MVVIPACQGPEASRQGQLSILEILSPQHSRYENTEKLLKTQNTVQSIFLCGLLSQTEIQANAVHKTHTTQKI